MSDVRKALTKFGILALLVAGAIVTSPQRAAADNQCCLECAREYVACLQTCGGLDGCSEFCIDEEQSCKSTCGVSPC